MGECLAVGLDAVNCLGDPRDVVDETAHGQSQAHSERVDVQCTQLY